MAKVRGVRFSSKEDALIEEFLRLNPMLDFSTLAKVSILEFIKKPLINLQAVGQPQKKEGRNVRPNT
jgi:hypothetical protein